jgi:small basic protein
MSSEAATQPGRPGGQASGSVFARVPSDGGWSVVLLPIVGLLVGIAAGWFLNVNVSFELSRYSAVAILAALDSVLGAVRAELDGTYNNRIFISGFVTNAIVAVILTFIGDRLSLDLYLVALINFGFRIFNNVALIRRHFI